MVGNVIPDLLLVVRARRATPCRMDPGHFGAARYSGLRFWSMRCRGLAQCVAVVVARMVAGSGRRFYQSSAPFLLCWHHRAPSPRHRAPFASERARGDRLSPPGRAAHQKKRPGGRRRGYTDACGACRLLLKKPRVRKFCASPQQVLKSSRTIHRFGSNDSSHKSSACSSVCGSVICCRRVHQVFDAFALQRAVSCG
ncbi:unnamed protein product [Amoebophrya sp. A120]|nr:unnamed protein product [Amoebophrya sp. A120]|eukprot:GSA120T00022204001.1